MEPTKLSLGTLLNRLTSPTPEFDAALRNFWLKTCGASIALLAVNAGMPAMIPAVIVTVAKIIGIISATGAIHAQAGKQPDPTTTTTNATDDRQSN